MAVDFSVRVLLKSKIVSLLEMVTIRGDGIMAAVFMFLGTALRLRRLIVCFNTMRLIMEPQHM